MPSAVLWIHCPAAFSVNPPSAKLARPATPTAPMSRSDQPEGRPLLVVGVTVRERLAILVKLPQVPVMVTVAVPVVAVALAVSVKVLVLVGLLGLKEAVTPLGRPEADKLTLPVKPFCGVTVIVLVTIRTHATTTLTREAQMESARREEKGREER